MKKSNLTGVLVLLVFTVFMVSVLLVLLSGADTVQQLTQRDKRTYHISPPGYVRPTKQVPSLPTQTP